MTVGRLERASRMHPATIERCARGTWDQVGDWRPSRTTAIGSIRSLSATLWLEVSLKSRPHVVHIWLTPHRCFYICGLFAIEFARLFTGTGITVNALRPGLEPEQSALGCQAIGEAYGAS